MSNPEVSRTAANDLLQQVTNVVNGRNAASLDTIGNLRLSAA